MTPKTDNRSRNHPTPDPSEAGGRRRAKLSELDKIDELQDFFDFSPVAYLSLDSKGRMLTANLTAIVMMKVVRSELVGQSLYDYVHPEDRDTLYLHLRRLFKDQKPQSCELRIQDADGRIIHAALQSIFVQDKKARRVCRTVIVDITERISYEQTLRDQAEQLHVAVEGGKLGTWSRDLITEEVVWNDYLYHLLGRDPEGPAITGESFFEYIHPDDIEHVRRHVEETFKTGEDFFDEFKIIREDGETRWLTASGRVFRNREGQPVRMAGVNYDITERKQNEEMLKESEARLAAAKDIAQLGIWEHDSAAAEIRFDERSREIFGFVEDRPVSDEEILRSIHPEDRKRVEADMAAAQDPQGTGRFESEYRILCRDGTIRWIAVYGNPIATTEGHRTGRSMGTLMDITARKQAEEALRKGKDTLEQQVAERTAELYAKNEELEKVNRMLETYTERITEEHARRIFLSKQLVELLETERRQIAMTLHDQIGQDMVTLKMDLEMLEARLPEGSESDRYLSSATQKATDIICYMRNFSQSLRPDVLDTLGLCAGIRNLIDRVKQQEGGIDIRFFSTNALYPIDLDKKTALYRICQEALTNCIKYAAADTIDITLTERDNKISLSIEDSGKGFDYQRAMELSGRGEGFQGISIMRERAIQLGGEFWVETAPGKGTLITAWIPIESGGEHGEA